MIASIYNFLLNICGSINIISSTNKKFRLYDGDKACLLSDTSKPAQSVCSFIEGIISRINIFYVNAESSAPLGATRSTSIVKSTLVIEVIKTTTPEVSYSTPPMRKLRPVSTLIPGMIPFEVNISVTGVLSAVYW